MPRPKSKSELLDAIATTRDKLIKLLGGLTAEQLVTPHIVGRWSVKDVLAHLSEWEQMCLGWYQAGLRDEIPMVPAVGFKWNQTPQLNQHIYETYRDWPLTKAQARFADSFQQICNRKRAK